jgi:hypothetical protein
MQSTAAAILINSASKDPSFASTTSDVLTNFVLEPLAMDVIPTQTKFEALPAKATMPVYIGRIIKITVAFPNGYHTVIETVSHWGNVKITLFGLLGPSLQSFQAGDEAIFFNLIQNAYNGQHGLKFGNRTGMFRTNGVHNLIISHPPRTLTIILLLHPHTVTIMKRHLQMCVVLPDPRPGLDTASGRGDWYERRIYDFRHAQ